MSTIKNSILIRVPRNIYQIISSVVSSTTCHHVRHQLQLVGHFRRLKTIADYNWWRTFFPRLHCQKLPRLLVVHLHLVFRFLIQPERLLKTYLIPQELDVHLRFAVHQLHLASNLTARLVMIQMMLPAWPSPLRLLPWKMLFRERRKDWWCQSTKNVRVTKWWLVEYLWEFPFSIAVNCSFVWWAWWLCFWKWCVSSYKRSDEPLPSHSLKQ